MCAEPLISSLKENMLKQCTRCNIEKDIRLYACDKYKKDGRRSQCKECNKLDHLKRYTANPARERARCDAYRAFQKIENPGKLELSSKKTKLKSTYGMTIEDFENMKDAQGGCCYVCRVAETSLKGRSLCVDHDHNTGKIRKLLCNSCNTSLGLLKENIDIMESLIAYVKENSKLA